MTIWAGTPYCRSTAAPSERTSASLRTPPLMRADVLWRLRYPAIEGKPVLVVEPPDDTFSRSSASTRSLGVSPVNTRSIVPWLTPRHGRASQRCPDNRQRLALRGGRRGSLASVQQRRRQRGAGSGMSCPHDYCTRRREGIPKLRNATKCRCGAPIRRVGAYGGCISGLSASISAKGRKATILFFAIGYGVDIT